MLLAQLMPLLRCVPQDFINPFVAYREPVTVCAVLLVLAALVLARTSQRRDTSRQARALQLAVGVPTLFVVIVAAWVWLQNLVWLPPCSPAAPFGTDWRFGLQVADLHIVPALVGVAQVVTVIVLVFDVALALLRLLRRDGRPAAQH